MFGIVLLLTTTLLAASETPPTKVMLPRGALTNDGILMLAEAGFDESFIADLISLRPARFDTSVEGLASLYRKGLSESIIRCMVAKETQPAKPSQPRVVQGRVSKRKVVVLDDEPHGALRWLPMPRHDSVLLVLP